MSKRIGVGLALVIPVLAVGALLVALPHGTPRGPHSSLSKPSARAGLPPPESSVGRRRDAADRAHQPQKRVADADQVARIFLHGWLGCTYHRARCTHIAGTFRAYAAALANQHASSLPTPAELAARPRIVSLQLLRGCDWSATAIATYRDGKGGRFELHINLILQDKRWEVFDVAEAAPHIPLPEALNHGAGRC